jgi:hypothetical protein
MLEIFERILRDAAGRAEYHYVVIDYLCRPVSREARPSSDAANVAWVRREELERYRMTESSMGVIHKGFDALARITV